MGETLLQVSGGGGGGSPSRERSQLEEVPAGSDQEAGWPWASFPHVHNVGLG